jgi:hypothetical protein
MARSNQCFTITLSNNKTEKDGVVFLTNNYDGFFQVTNQEKKQVLDLLGMEHRFSRAFDLIYIENYIHKICNEAVINANIDDILLIELKSTKKYLPNNPTGFFFGATENEFTFAKKLGDRFRFCFVCLHPDSLSQKLITLQELESRIKTRRIQYQINL